MSIKTEESLECPIRKVLVVVKKKLKVQKEIEFYHHRNKLDTFLEAKKPTDATLAWPYFRQKRGERAF